MIRGIIRIRYTVLFKKILISDKLSVITFFFLSLMVKISFFPVKISWVYMTLYESVCVCVNRCTCMNEFMFVFIIMCKCVAVFFVHVFKCTHVFIWCWCMYMYKFVNIHFFVVVFLFFLFFSTHASRKIFAPDSPNHEIRPDVLYDTEV